MIMNRNIYGTSGEKSLFRVTVNTLRAENVSFNIDGIARILWGDGNRGDFTSGTASHDYTWYFPLIDNSGPEIKSSGYTFFDGKLKVSVCDEYTGDLWFSPDDYGFTRPFYRISEALGIEFETFEYSFWTHSTMTTDYYDDVECHGYILPNGTKLASGISVEKNRFYVLFKPANVLLGNCIRESIIKLDNYKDNDGNVLYHVDDSWIFSDYFVAFDQMQEVSLGIYAKSNGITRPEILHNFKVFGEHLGGIHFIGDAIYDTWYDRVPAFASFKDKRDFKITIMGHVRKLSFEGCTQLTSIDEPISSSYKSKDYSRMFKGCTGLTRIPTDLFSKILEANDFTECFSGCTALTGEAPPLWLMFPNAIGNACFNGCTGLSNYSSIPSNWKF